MGVGDGKKRDFKMTSKFKPEDRVETGNPINIHRELRQRNKFRLECERKEMSE